MAVIDLLSQESAALVAQKIIKIINKPFKIMNQKREIGVSIGVSFYPAVAKSVAGLLKCADAAMYKAKQSGRNKYFIFQ